MIYKMENIKIILKVQVARYPKGTLELYSGVFSRVPVHDITDEVIECWLQENPIHPDENGVVWNWTIETIEMTKEDVTGYFEFESLFDTKDIKDELINFYKKTIDAQKDIINSQKRTINSLESSKVKKNLLDIINYAKELSDEDLDLLYGSFDVIKYRKEHDLSEEEYNFLMQYNISGKSMFKLSPAEAKIKYAESLGQDTSGMKKELDKKIKDTKVKYKELLSVDDYKLKVKVYDRLVSFDLLVSYISHIYWGAFQQEHGLINYENERVKKHQAICKQLGFDRTDRDNNKYFDELERLLSVSDDCLNAQEGVDKLKKYVIKHNLYEIIS